MLFSIVTVCRNDLYGLELTFRSVASQSCDDYELIVVDGNSKDGTVDWLSNLNFSRLRWITEPDKGIFDAMNKGIGMAKGRYLIFMNSFDEFAHGNVLKEISCSIKESRVEPKLIYGDSIDVALDLKEYYKKARRPQDLWKGMFASHQAIIFKNNKNLLYPLRYKYASDYAYIALHLKEIPEEGILYLEQPLCKFKLGGCNETERYPAIKEDYLIRRDVIKIGVPKCMLLYVLHAIHTFLKRSFPGITRQIRYVSIRR